MKKILYILVFLVAVAGIVEGGLYLKHRQEKSEAVNAVDKRLVLVGMGDSVAAGIGLPTASDSSACGRTDESYIYKVAKTTDRRMINLACSGASIDQGLLGNQTVNKAELVPQAQQLFNIDQPDVVTLTIGANDIGWSELLAKCYSTECGTLADGQTIDGRLATLTEKYKSFLDQYKSHYGAKIPRLIVTGYFQVLPASMPENCTEMAGIDREEIAWQHEELGKLNQTIKDTVDKYSFARFAEIDFTNHELCSDDAWVQGINDKAPFHPNESGQVEFARMVSALVKNK